MKKDIIVSLKVTECQNEFLNNICDLLGVSRSDYIRMLINVNMANLKGDVVDENEGSNLDNKL